MKIQDRIKELRRVPASELVPNPANWRKHSPAQKAALRGVLKQVGFAGAELVRELPDGRLMLIDGHLRADICGDAVIPVLVLDVTESEADVILATFDPLGAMAEADAAQLDKLLRSVQTDDEALSKMLAELAEEAGIIPPDSEEAELRPLKVMPLPDMTWVLIGIPTVQFGAIAATVESVAAIEGCVVETTSNNA